MVLSSMRLPPSPHKKAPRNSAADRRLEEKVREEERYLQVGYIFRVFWTVDLKRFGPAYHSSLEEVKENREMMIRSNGKPYSRGSLDEDDWKFRIFYQEYRCGEWHSGNDLYWEGAPATPPSAVRLRSK